MNRYLRVDKLVRPRHSRSWTVSSHRRSPGPSEFISMMMVICALLLARAARAQHEAKDDGLTALLTPMYGEACGYESCLPIKPGWLNVHIVPQTHSELGHVYNFEQHFTGEEKPYMPNVMNMKRILDAVLTQLWEDERRKFTLSDTAYLFHWWSKRHPTVHRMMYELIRQGRLTLVGGGLSISDEASTSYHAIIDQFTYSLRKLNTTFRACARPLVAWAVDVYGHSREFTSLMAQMGYDALFINPISYDEEVARMRRKALEFVWRGSDDLGAPTDIFTHNLFDGYWAPPGFCFSKLCSDPLLITSSRTFANIQDRIDKFIEGVLYRQAPNYETRNIMVIMGHRKAYFDADVWFANIEKLISFTNWRAHQKGLNITLFYSNPACYLSAVHDENPELETKQDDFFPYVHDKDSYTVGMYTSRPNFKYLIREAHIYLQIVKQMHVTANMVDDNFLDEFNWIMGVVQDHSVATGVLRLPVKQYYVSKIHFAILRSTLFMTNAFSRLRESPNYVIYNRCLFNISSCRETRYLKHSIQVYNPLGWPVTTPVRLPVAPVNSKFRVYDTNGVEIPSETIKLPEAITEIPGRPTADYELVFIANNIPPVGFRSYYIEAQLYRAKRTIIKRVKMAKTKKYLLNMPIEEEENQESDETEETDKTTIKTVNKDTSKDTIATRDTNTRKGPRKNKKNEMKVLGLDTNIKKERNTAATEETFVVPEQQKSPKIFPNAPRKLATVVLKDPAKANNARNVIQVESIVKNERPERTTEAELIMLPMLRDYLNKQNILQKLNFVDTESEFASDEFNRDESTTTTEIELENEGTSKPDTRRNEYILPFPTRAPDVMLPVRTDATESDIRVPIRRRTTMEPDIKVIDRDSDIKVPVRIDSDIRVPFRTNAAELDVREPVQISTTESDISEPLRTTTTDSDISVPIRLNSDIRVPLREETETDIRVPIKKRVIKTRGKTIETQSTAKENQTPVRINTVNKEPIRTTTIKVVQSSSSTTESLAIVPVRTASIEATATLSAYWYMPTPTESVLVVPVKRATTESILLDEISTATTKKLIDTTKVSTEQSITEKEEIREAEKEDEGGEEEEDTTSPTEFKSQSIDVPLKTSVATAKLKTIPVKSDDFNTEAGDSDALIDTDAIVSAEVIDKERISNAQRFRSAHIQDVSSTTTVEREETRTEEVEIEASTEPEAETATSQSISSTQSSVDSGSDYTTIGSTKVKFVTTVPTTQIVRTIDEKYFKVDGGGQLFIGNKYVRVNLNRKRRVASVFLSNGIRITLGIQMFHYVSDDPSKFDIREVPRRSIKPPGAYIFRPIDPHIIKMDEAYDAQIVKTSIVEEIRISYNSWASLMIRLYVDSPVIEVHWLVGPIPTDDGLGRDVFIRYTTDLEHDGAFYTDSNGRQTIKRIRGARATYDPVDLDPITGNLYPVTSKIYIQDAARNIRFSVFNDRCQAGGAVVDGAIDLMVHRRILTDDIGFGAYLNETEGKNGEGIRAAGTHYLYVTKADKNRIFEKKFAKEIAMAPRILTSDPHMYSDDLKRQFYECKNEYSALKGRLPIGVHLLSFEKIGADELLVRFENYLEKSDVLNDGVKYIALRNMFNDVRVVWLRETTLAANMFKEQWSPTQWKKKNKFFRSFNEYYGTGNDTYEEGIESVTDELGGRGIRLAPQQIRTFIVKYEYTGPHAAGTTEEP